MLLRGASRFRLVFAQFGWPDGFGARPHRADRRCGHRRSLSSPDDVTDRDSRRRPRAAGRPSRGSRSSTLADPRDGEVRVRMLASGVCHSDLHVRDGEWDRPGPIVMGHEGAGRRRGARAGRGRGGDRASRSGGSSRWRGRRRAAAAARASPAGPGSARTRPSYTPPDAGRHVAAAAGRTAAARSSATARSGRWRRPRSCRSRPRSRCRTGRRRTSRR